MVRNSDTRAGMFSAFVLLFSCTFCHAVESAKALPKPEPQKKHVVLAPPQAVDALPPKPVKPKLSESPSSEGKATSLDWLTFIARVVEAVAWPAVALTIILTFRKRIDEILHRVKSFKVPGFEADVSAELKSIQIEADAANLPPVESGEALPIIQDEPTQERYRRISEHSPEAAVLEIWQDLQFCVKEVFQRLERRPMRSSGELSSMLNRLASDGRIDPQVLDVYHRLRRVRNAVAHPTRDHRISSSEANEFVGLASRLILQFVELVKDPQGAEPQSPPPQ